MCLVDLQGNLLEVNSKMTEIFGYSKNELERMTVNDLALPEDMKISPEYIQHAVKGQSKQAIFEKHYRHKDGHIVYGLVSSSLVNDSDGKPIFFISQVQDITRQKHTEDELRISERRHHILAENTKDVVWTMNLDGIVTYISPAVEKLLGLTSDEALNQSLDQFLTPDSLLVAIDYLTRLSDAVKNGMWIENFHEELEYQRKDGSRLWTEVVACPIYGDGGRLVEILCLTRDIDERKRLEEQISHMAFYDALTELPNRRLLTDRLNQLLVAKKRSGLYGALLFIDLDNFKPLNDVHGHEAGDLLLIEVGKRIKSCLREMDTVARIGGDEFVALIGQLEGDKAKSLAQAKAIAEKILHALSQPYRIAIPHGQEAGLTIEHHCTASIGAAVFSGQVMDPEVILSMADVAMYAAKEAGRNQVKLNSSVI